MASLRSIANCTKIVAVVLFVLGQILSANGVYVRDRKKDPGREGVETGGSDQRISLWVDGRLQETAEDSSEEREFSPQKREPFQRILVLCNQDNECERKSFCHGGEGHKSCLPCRRTRRRCQRNGMCCHGDVCQTGRCVPKYDVDDAKSVQSYDEEEESISQHTRDNMRKRREDEECGTSDECAAGLCCAQHFWTRICKRILVEGDVCTKKRDRYTDVFQRCHCGGTLSCKRHPAPDERYHTCQHVKGGKRIGVQTGDDGEDTDGGSVEAHQKIKPVFVVELDEQTRLEWERQTYFNGSYDYKMWKETARYGYNNQEQSISDDGEDNTNGQQNEDEQNAKTAGEANGRVGGTNNTMPNPESFRSRLETNTERGHTDVIDIL